MKKKRPFLLALLLFILSSCSMHSNISILKDPPSDQFVKIYKSLEITRCSKNPEKNTNNPKKKKKKCETKHFFSSGSGLIIKLSEKQEIILSAGHVCRSEGLIQEDKLYKYSWIETVKLLDRNRRFHQGHIILFSQAGPKSSDLCALYSPSLGYLKEKTNISISPRAPRTGEDIYYIGAPIGIYHPPTALIIRGNYAGNIDRYSALISAPGAPGASGSVILSLDNRIYGVLFAVHPRFRNATVITSYEETRDFLRKVEKELKGN